jgi:hypothetical protein
MRKNIDKGRCPLDLSEEDVIHNLLDCLGTRNWIMKFLNDKWLRMNKDVAYRKILRCSTKDRIRNVSRYLDKISINRLTEQK